MTLFAMCGWRNPLTNAQCQNSPNRGPFCAEHTPALPASPKPDPAKYGKPPEGKA